MADFATYQDVQNVWRPLSQVEQENARLLLAAAAKWIRDRLPDIADGDPTAKLVSIQVTKAALIPGAFEGHSSYSKGIGPWSKSGSLINPAAVLVFTDEHKELLGIAPSGGPHWNFEDC